MSCIYGAKSFVLDKMLILKKLRFRGFHHIREFKNFTQNVFVNLRIFGEILAEPDGNL
jgi:hypothetical protein